jgi:4-amino-4-deoxy-L-arabinose transferase-like glycosyltransferase
VTESLLIPQWLKVDLRTFANIRFWLFVSVVLHFTGINQPPLETSSQWSQAKVLMIARNFNENSHNIFFPTIDYAGQHTGIIGGEFPIFNYLIFLLSIPFGFHDWFGRLINVLVSTAGVYFFYRMIKDAFGEKTAFNSSLILLTSLWFSYSRVSLPDVFAASLCLISLHFGIRYLKAPTIGGLVLFFVTGLLGCLSRASAASLMTVVLIPLFFADGRMNAKIATVAVVAAIFDCVWTWYFVWWPHLTDTFNPTGHNYLETNFSVGASMLVEQWPQTLKRFYFNAFKYSGFLVFLGGLYFVFKTRNQVLFYAFALPFVAYAIIVLNIAVGFTVDIHYTVMFLPPMALVAGYGLSQVNRKACLVLLVIIAAEGIGNQIHLFKLSESQKPWLTLEEAMNQVTERSDFIAITGTAPHDPLPMYMAHRRGWVIAPNDLKDSKKLNELANAGCRYFVVASMYSNSTLNLPLVYQSADFSIYRARAPTSLNPD